MSTSGQGEEDRRAPFSKWAHGTWRIEVEVRVRELRNRLAFVQAYGSNGQAVGGDGPGGAAGRKGLEAAVVDSLATAEGATSPPPRRRDGLRSWWSGSAMTTGWESVHEAELRLLQLERDADLRTHLPRLRAWIQRAMDKGDRRTRYEKGLRAEARRAGAIENRTAIYQAFEDVVVENNERYASLRAFRNNLIVVTGVLAALVVLLSLVHLADPGFLTLCSGGTEVNCLDGGSSGRGDVLLVALVGALGGMLAIAFGLAETKANPSRFDPKVWLALLKPVAGAATALVAVLLIQADILLGSSDSRSESLLLSYAAIFGFSQQLLTRFVDKRAGKLIGTEAQDGEPPEDPEEEKTPDTPDTPDTAGTEPGEQPRG